jgi:hypothetical protein
VLSHDTIVLVGNRTFALEICRIVEEPESDTPSLRTLARLGLPPLAPEVLILRSYCFPEQVAVYSEAPSFVVEGRPPRRHPFHNSPEEGVVAFSIVFQVNFRKKLFFTIVTHVRTLIAHATTTLPEVNLIPWNDWGPSGTACFERGLHPLFDACVGERLATISDGSLTLLDFNSMRVQNTIQKVGHPSRDAVHSAVKDRVVIPRGQLFGIDVVSELPHISASMPAPFAFPISNDNEGLAGFSKNVRGQTFSLAALRTDYCQTARAKKLTSTYTQHDRMISTGHPRCVWPLIQRLW